MPTIIDAGMVDARLFTSSTNLEKFLQEKLNCTIILPFSKCIFHRVQLTDFQVGKERLYWSCGEGIRSRVDDGQSELSDRIHSLLAVMILSIIEQDYCIGPPLDC